METLPSCQSHTLIKHSKSFATLQRIKLKFIPSTASRDKEQVNKKVNYLLFEFTTG